MTELLCNRTNEQLRNNLEQSTTHLKVLNSKVAKCQGEIDEINSEIDRRISLLTSIKSFKVVKTDNSTCGFNKAWIGACESRDLLENGQCCEHQTKCHCGKLATNECSHTFQLVCGRPLCDTCKCNH